MAAIGRTVPEQIERIINEIGERVAAEELLASWNDTPTRRAIVDFVGAVAGHGPDVVPPEQRVAVFDNDGTLWTEKPMPTQLHYVVNKWRQQLAADPSLAERQPYQAVASGDLAWLGRAVDKHYDGDDSDLRLLIKEIVMITANRTVDDYAAEIADFYRARNIWNSSGPTAKPCTNRWSSCCATSRPTASRPTSSLAASATSCDR